MSNKLLEFLKAGPTSPPVVLLPDDRFFVRVIPTDAAATAADVGSQVELALETISPFPPSQLFYGYHWAAGSPHALVFACYRKRFGSDQTSTWADSHVVLPAFGSVLGLEPEPATAVVIPSAEGITVVHWSTGAVPNAVAHKPVAADATEQDRAAVRDALLKSVGESTKVIDLLAVPEASMSEDESDFIFKSGDLEVTLPVKGSGPLDVRDKDDLDALRRARKRDLIVWRGFMGCIAALVVIGLFEIGVVAARKTWFKAMDTLIEAQKPTVASIQEADTLAMFIQNLNSPTKKLLPLEMLSLIHPSRATIRNTGVTFTTINVQGDIHELTIGATATTGGEYDAYLNALKSQPGVASVRLNSQQTGRGGSQTFNITVSFKPESLSVAN